MIANKAMFLRVGLLLAVGIAAAVALVLFLSGDRVRNGWRYETYFRESVQGLVVGAPVKFRGVKLGEVTEIALVSAIYPDAMPQDTTSKAYQLVVVRFTVDPSKTGRVPEPTEAIALGLRARLASQGITGVAYIELDFVDPKKFPPEPVPWKPRDTYLPSMPSTIAQVQDVAQALLAKLQAVDLVRLAAGIQTLLDDLHAQMTTGDVHSTLLAAQTLLQGLHTAVDQANLPGLAGDLRGTADAVTGLVQSKQVKQITAAAAQGADAFAAAARRLPQLLQTLDAAVRRADNSVGDLQHDLEPALRDARAAAANLRDTSETLRRYPSYILLGPPPPREMPK